MTWTVDLENKRVTAEAWGGQLVAFRHPRTAKWCVTWSDGAGLEITAHPHWVVRLGLDAAPEVFEDAKAEHIALFDRSASYNGARSIFLHLKLEFWDRLDPAARSDKGPGSFIGPDPF